jgi:hypothetical protein
MTAIALSMACTDPGVMVILAGDLDQGVKADRSLMQ